MENKKEIWKIYNDSNGKYSVSSKGRVFNNLKNKEVPTRTNKRGDYKEVSYNYLGKQYCTNVGRLMLLTFKPIKDPQNYHADHINDNGFDDSLDNLQWLTPEENNKKRRSNSEYAKIVKEIRTKYNEKDTLFLLNYILINGIKILKK